MLLVKYSIFAAFSISVNLAFQFLSFKLYTGFGSLYLGMFVGTLSGLVAKYFLDKKWIFYHVTAGKSDDAKKFALYSLMGVFTTMIFWGTEIIFDYLVPIHNAKYIGAILGLTIGYVIKYNLDKKYVFVEGGKSR
ncbi:GtrA family protein [Pseudoalteromonas sp. L21]|uniref:GtrA family protein n=1 Tax=unclassified Pseudoalteromonas TaxID=194690 RepID=UPI001F2141C9|nr:GtrA family protein [Pseudoalteromonas sp. L21]MCF7518714.1 GtrA family protein [Pseudoalteromonas sp. L21]|tara:strand:- start:4467 stop:4871 length:405 start_codon:yes stop_codon:yes gene_type:complete